MSDQRCDADEFRFDFSLWIVSQGRLVRILLAGMILLAFPELAHAGFMVWAGSGTGVRTYSPDGTALGFFSVPGPGVEALAVVGQEVWLGSGGVHRYSLDGTALGSFSVSGPGVEALAVVGQEVWLGSGGVHRYSLDGTALGSFSVSGPGVEALAVVGQEVWVGSGGVHRYSLDGTALGSFSVSGPGVAALQVVDTVVVPAPPAWALILVGAIVLLASRRQQIMFGLFRPWLVSRRRSSGPPDGII